MQDVPQTVYRPAYRRFVCVAYVALALYATVASAPRLSVMQEIALVAVVVAVGIAMYALAWRPSVEVTDAGVQVRNVWQDVEIAWRAVQDVESRMGLRIRTEQRHIDVWAAPATRNPEVLAQRRRASSATILTVNPLASATQARAGRSAQEAAEVAENPGDTGAAGATTNANAAAAMVQAAWDRWKGRRAGTESAAPSLPDAGPAAEAGQPVADEPAGIAVRWQSRLVAVQVAALIVAAGALLLAWA